MNAYCKHNVRQFYLAFIARVFDQDDVAVFIVLTRDYSREGSIIRELGDFLAHPKFRIKGIVLKSVETAAMDFEENCVRYIREENLDPPTFKGLGTLDELMKELHDIFQLAGVALQRFERDGESFRDFVFCTIFLLGSFSIKHKGRLFELKVEYSHSLTLYISYQSIGIPNYFAMLPVLSLGNVWIACPMQSTKYPLKDHVARRFEGGFLGAIAYEDDTPHRSHDAEAFNKGKVWPLPNPQRR